MRLLVPLVIASAVVGACSGPVDLPKDVLGTWQAGDDFPARLRFEQHDKGGQVFLLTSGAPFGPLPLSQAGRETWRFTLTQIETRDGNTTTRMRPPQATTAIQYGVDQNGRRGVLGATELAQEGEVVTLRRDGSRLVASGLWRRVEIQKVDSEGKPTDKKVTPLDTPLTLMPPMPAVPDETIVSGMIEPFDSGSGSLLVVVVAVKQDGGWTEGTGFPESKVEPSGRFAVRVSRAFAEEAWQSGYQKFGLAVKPDPGVPRLLRGNGTPAQFVLDANRPAIDVGKVAR